MVVLRNSSSVFNTSSSANLPPDNLSALDITPTPSPTKCTEHKSFTNHRGNHSRKYAIIRELSAKGQATEGEQERRDASPARRINSNNADRSERYAKRGKNFTHRYGSGARRFALTMGRESTVIQRSFAWHPSESHSHDWVRVVALAAETELDRHLLMREFCMFRAAAGGDGCLGYAEIDLLLQKSMVGGKDAAARANSVKVREAMRGLLRGPGGSYERMLQASLSFEDYIRGVHQIANDLAKTAVGEVFEFYSLNASGLVYRHEVLKTLKEIVSDLDYLKLKAEVEAAFSVREEAGEEVKEHRKFAAFVDTAQHSDFYLAFQRHRYKGLLTPAPATTAPAHGALTQDSSKDHGPQEHAAPAFLPRPGRGPPRAPPRPSSALALVGALGLHASPGGLHDRPRSASPALHRPRSASPALSAHASPPRHRGFQKFRDEVMSRSSSPTLHRDATIAASWPLPPAGRPASAASSAPSADPTAKQAKSLRLLGLKQPRSSQFESVAGYVEALMLVSHRLHLRAKWQQAGRFVLRQVRETRQSFGDKMSKMFRQLITELKREKAKAEQKRKNRQARMRKVQLANSAVHAIRTAEADKDDGGETDSDVEEDHFKRQDSCASSAPGGDPEEPEVDRVEQLARELDQDRHRQEQLGKALTRYLSVDDAKVRFKADRFAKDKRRLRKLGAAEVAARNREAEQQRAAQQQPAPGPAARQPDPAAPEAALEGSEAVAPPVQDAPASPAPDPPAAAAP